MRRRFALFTAALLAALASTFVAASPAQAATIHGCRAGNICLYGAANFNDAYGGDPDIVIPVSYMLQYPNGRHLSDWGFDNRLNGVVNNSGSETRYRRAAFAQYPDGTGFYWIVYAQSARDYTGWWRRDRASRIWVF